MKKIFGDNIISKLRTVPSFVWILFVVISFFFAHAYEFLITGEGYAYEMAGIYRENEIELNIATLGIVFSIIEALFSAIVFEAIIALAFNWVVGRFRCNINRSDYKFRLRYFIILCNLIIGVLSIGYFFTQYENGVINPNISLFSGKVNYLLENPYYSIQNSILPFTIFSVFALFFFEDFRTRFVPKRNHAALFSRFAFLFIGVNFILFVFMLFKNFLMLQNTVTPVYETIAYSLQGVIYAAVGFIYYFYYRKIKKEGDDIDNPNPPANNSDNKKETIFDEFGF